MKDPIIWFQDGKLTQQGRRDGNEWLATRLVLELALKSVEEGDQDELYIKYYNKRR